VTRPRGAVARPFCNQRHETLLKSIVYGAFSRAGQESSPGFSGQGGEKGNQHMKTGPEESVVPEHEEPPNLSSLPWWKNWKFMLPIWGIIAAIIWGGTHYNIDKQVIAASVFVIGLLSNAFAWLLGLLSVIPFIGPLIVKVLSLGFIWLLNAVGYLVSFIAIRRGYSKDVLTYRGVTIALIVGIVIGYVIGKLV
jgi:hypothetical protein